jgi:hypothetical protein
MNLLTAFTNRHYTLDKLINVKMNMETHEIFPLEGYFVVSIFVSTVIFAILFQGGQL